MFFSCVLDRCASMAKRVLDEIMTGINAKKPKTIGRKAIEDDEEETCGDRGCPSTPVTSKPRKQLEVRSKTPKERVAGKGTMRSLVVNDRKGRKKLHQCGFVASSEAESDSDSSESSSDDDSSSEADERNHTQREKIKILSSSTKENIPPPSTSVGKQSDPSTSMGKQCDDQSELAKTNALLHSLLKRIKRQDKKISDMQSKLSQSSTISSASTDSMPRRRSASDRRKEVPLEVRRETRRVYNMLSGDDDFSGWKLERGVTFRSPENQVILDILIKEVKGLNPTFSTQHISDAAYRFYKTKCEEDSIKRRGKTVEKQQRKRTRERLTRKLDERKKALQALKFSRENDKLLWEKVLILWFMSSEESDLDNEEEVLTLHPLPWRAEKVDTLFHKLDEITLKAKSPQAQRQMKRRVLGAESSRSSPSVAGVPSWAVVLD